MASRLVWGLCASAAVTLASATLMRTLRADEAIAPWAQWFALAHALTPGPVAGLEVPAWSWLRADAWGSAFGWAVAALGWLVLGLVVALALRPGARRTSRRTTTHSRASRPEAVQDGQ